MKCKRRTMIDQPIAVRPPGGGGNPHRIGLSDLLADPPLLHGGGTSIWRLSEEVMEFIDQQAERGSRTLETGAGLSTVLFALKDCHHTCVVPLQEEVNRLQDYCRVRDISLRQVKFEVERSEVALPRLNPGPLDLILVDGNHAFPAPFIDWYYSTPFLREGGILIVDDTNLWTGDILRRFLEAETAEWRQLETFSGRAAAFRKLASGSVTKGWEEQALLVKKSRSLTRRHKLYLAWRLARRGELLTLVKKTVSSIARGA